MSARADAVVLEGRVVRLEPLSRDHITPLAAVGLDEDLWRWTIARVRTRDEMSAYVEAALELERHGVAIPFATVDRASGRVVGSTRFGSIDRANRRVEIGWTWIARPWQRTALNTEAKYLMFRHAFEVLDCIRVELKTDALNERSRTAIARLGAVEEGVLRSHMITAAGRVRDTVYYSIIADEWPRVRAALEARLAPRHAMSSDDAAFVAEFEACRFPAQQFDHRAHVRLAYAYLVDADADVAAARMRRALLAFLRHNGIDPSKYHETITRAWVLAVRHFMQQSGGAASADDFIAAHPQLLDPKIMLTHYSAEVLFSGEARQRFVEPDIDGIPG